MTTQDDSNDPTSSVGTISVVLQGRCLQCSIPLPGRLDMCEACERFTAPQQRDAMRRQAARKAEKVDESTRQANMAGKMGLQREAMQHELESQLPSLLLDESRRMSTDSFHAIRKLDRALVERLLRHCEHLLPDPRNPPVDALVHAFELGLQAGREG